MSLFWKFLNSSENQSQTQVNRQVSPIVERVGKDQEPHSSPSYSPRSSTEFKSSSSPASSKKSLNASRDDGGNSADVVRSMSSLSSNQSNADKPSSVRNSQKRVSFRSADDRYKYRQSLEILKRERSEEHILLMRQLLTNSADSETSSMFETASEHRYSSAIENNRKSSGLHENSRRESVETRIFNSGSQPQYGGPKLVSSRSKQESSKNLQSENEDHSNRDSRPSRSNVCIVNNVKINQISKNFQGIADHQVTPNCSRSVTESCTNQRKEPNFNRAHKSEQVAPTNMTKNTMEKQVVKIQSIWKGRRARLTYKSAVNQFYRYVNLAQSLIRMYLQRKRYRKTKEAIIRLQSVWRAKKLRVIYKPILRKRKIRKNIINEIISTEVTYVESLITCCEVFIHPLLKNMLISHEEAHIIFSNLDYKIVKIHQKFLDMLEIRAETWKVHEPKHEDQMIGDICLEMVEEFKSYHHYITNYDKSIEMLTKCSNDPAFAQYLQEAKMNPRCNLLGASDFLIMPIQRLPRYELLLTDLLKFTEQTHKDFAPLSETLSQLKQITKYINERKREVDSLSRMMIVNSKVIGTSKPLSIVQEGRVLLREGSLFQVSKLDEKETEIYVFLFNDIIMAAKETTVRKNILEKTMRYNHQHNIPLQSCIVEDIAQEEMQGNINESCFKLRHNEKEYVWKASNVSQKNQWVQAIRNSIEKLSSQSSISP